MKMRERETNAENVQSTYLYTFMHSLATIFSYLYIFFCCSHIEIFYCFAVAENVCRCRHETTFHSTILLRFRESECVHVHNKHLTSNRDKVRNIAKIPFLIFRFFSTRMPATAYWNCWKKKESKKLGKKCVLFPWNVFQFQRFGHVYYSLLLLFAIMILVFGISIGSSVLFSSHRIFTFSDSMDLTNLRNDDILNYNRNTVHIIRQLQFVVGIGRNSKQME